MIKSTNRNITAIIKSTNRNITAIIKSTNRNITALVQSTNRNITAITKSFNKNITAIVTHTGPFQLVLLFRVQPCWPKVFATVSQCYPYGVLLLDLLHQDPNQDPTKNITSYVWKHRINLEPTKNIANYV